MYVVLRAIGIDEIEAGQELYVKLGEVEADDPGNAVLEAADGTGGEYVTVAGKSWRTHPSLGFKTVTKAVWGDNGAQSDPEPKSPSEASQAGNAVSPPEDGSQDALAGAEVVDAREDLG